MLDNFTLLNRRLLKQITTIVIESKKKKFGFQNKKINKRKTVLSTKQDQNSELEQNMGSSMSCYIKNIIISIYRIELGRNWNGTRVGVILFIERRIMLLDQS